MSNEVRAGSSGSLRVLVVTVAAGGIGGMQRHTHDLVRGLTAHGHDVEVICPRAADLETDLYGARWTLLEARGRDKARWVPAVRSAFEMARRRGRFDVIHSESTSALPLVDLDVARPIVVKYHGNYVDLAGAHIRRGLARPRTAHREAVGLLSLTQLHFRHGNAWRLRDCTSMLVSRQQVRGTVLSHFLRRDRVHVVPNGVDVRLFKPRDRALVRAALSLEADVVSLAAVGRLNSEKGFDVALEAFERIARVHPEARLLIIGDGEERARLESLARELEVEHATHFIGSRSRDELAQYLAGADVFLFPTRRNEAGPLVLLEAMACGLPTVASRIGGITEVIEPEGDDKVGILVRPGVADDVETAIRRLLRDGALRASLGAAARQRAVSEYSLDAMIARTVAVYRVAIARERGVASVGASLPNRFHD
jgi:glycosyltransferase involved in cell wall biosynthesis